MQTRLLGHTGLQLHILRFGASSLGAEFRNVTVDEVLASVRVALECGLNFIDTMRSLKTWPESSRRGSSRKPA